MGIQRLCLDRRLINGCGVLEVAILDVIVARDTWLRLRFGTISLCFSLTYHGRIGHTGIILSQERFCRIILSVLVLLISRNSHMLGDVSGVLTQSLL